MGSRDFGFLSLRPPLVAYQANGLPVPPNNVLTTSNTGAASFASTITISTINANIANTNTTNSNSISSNVIDANTISATYVDVTILSTTTHYTSTISTTTLDTGYLQANQVLINSTLKVEGNSEFEPLNPSTLGGFKIQLNGTGGTDAAGSNLFIYRYPGTDNTYLNNTGGGSIILGTANAYVSTLQINSNGNVNVNGNLTVSDRISTNTIITQYLSTFSTINLMNGNAVPLELTWNTSTLFIDGHPVATDGTVSTVSSVFWQDNGGFGNIVNKNVGVGATKYLVGVGTPNGVAINATLDVQYAGGSNPGNVLNVSTSNGKNLTFDSNGVLLTNGAVYMNDILQISTIGENGALQFVTQSGNTYIESGNNFSSGSGNKLYFTNIDNVLSTMVLDTNAQRVGINTDNPVEVLDVNGNIHTSGYLSTNIINMTNGSINFSSVINIDSNSAGINTGIINIGTAYNPTITLGSAGSTKTHTINGTTDVNGDINIINDINNTDSNSINFFKSISSLSTVNNTELGYLYFNGTDINSVTKSSALIYARQDGNAGNGYVPGKLSFHTSGNAVNPGSGIPLRMIINSQGNVGINTSTPQTTLDVKGDITLSDTLYISSTNGNTSGSITVMNGGPLELANTAGDIIIHSQTGVTQFNSASGSNYGQIQVADPSGTVSLTGTNINLTPSSGLVSTIGSLSITNNLNVTGTAISRVAVSTINSNPSDWSNFYGKYCFVTLIGTPLNIGGSADDGTILVFRNVTSDNSPITVNGNTILAGKTLSFVYTTTSGISAGWYSL